MVADDPLDRPDDVEEADATVVEGVDGDLVGGVVGGRGGPPCGADLARDPDRGECVVVDRLEAPVHRA